MIFLHTIRTFICVIALSLLGSAPAFSGEIKATLIAGHPPALRWVARLSETFTPTVDAALSGTDHHIAWDTQFGGSLGGVGEELETTAEGLAEIGLVLSVFDPAKLAIQNVSYYTPFSTVDTSRVLETMAGLHRDNQAFMEPWAKNGLTYLGGGVGTADYILMTKVPVAAPGDLKGLKLGVAGPGATWLTGTDAVAVSGNLTTYYTNLKSGVLDGAIVPENTALPTKLYEVAPYILKVGFGAQYAGGLAANSGWYEKQPEAVQAALHKGADAYSQAFEADLVRMAEDALAEMQKRGATVAHADAAFRQSWVDGMDDIAATWTTSLEGDGVAVLKSYMAALRASGEAPLRDWGGD